MAYISAAINKLTENNHEAVTEYELQNELNKSVGENKTEVSNVDGTLYVTFFDTTHNYKVESGKVSKIDAIPENEYTGIILTADNASEYGATYTDSSGNTKNFTDEVEDGDIVTCGEYEYRYNVYIESYNDVGEAYKGSSNIDSSINGWSVLLASSNIGKESYPEICGNIFNKNVTNISRLFGHCTNLVEAPKIPNKVTNMSYTFYGCNNLINSPKIPKEVINMTGTYWACITIEKAPDIPESVENLERAFWNCQNMQTVSVIPSNVKNMTDAFYSCFKLTGTITINANPLEYSSCFLGTQQPIVLNGSSTVLSELAATASQNNISVK